MEWPGTLRFNYLVALIKRLGRFSLNGQWHRREFQVGVSINVIGDFAGDERATEGIGNVLGSNGSKRHAKEIVIIATGGNADGET